MFFPVSLSLTSKTPNSVWRVGAVTHLYFDVRSCCSVSFTKSINRQKVSGYFLYGMILIWLSAYYALLALCLYSLSSST